MSETFGRYTVISQLGRGAMGVVYLASDPMLNRQVAVKTVDLSVQEPTEREFLRDRLLRDARAAAVLKHPNIVSVYDVFEDAGRAYVVMEYIEGESLAARLKSNPAPDVATILKVLRQMADALDYTHARGVIHRDIKPANVMIDSTGTTKIMDFGIARISDTRTCTPTGMVMGTVEYMAPEQILGESVDGRADQFALAVVAYQMMTGSTIFGPNTVATLTYKIVHEAPTLPCARNGALPRGVDAVLAKALAKKPEYRFASCADFVNALATAFTEAPTAPLPAPAATGTVRAATTATIPNAPQAPSSRAPIAVAAIAVVLLAGALAAVILKPWAHKPEPVTTAVVTPPVTAPPESTATPEKTAPPASTPRVPDPVKQPATQPPAAPAENTPPVREPAPKTTPEPVKPLPPNVDPPRGGSTVKPDIISTPVESAPVTEDLPPEPKVKLGQPYIQAMQRGMQAVRGNDYVTAVRAFGDAVGLRPESAQAHYSRGAAFQHLNQFDAAARDYEDAIRLEPRMVMAYVALGGCLEQQHRDPDALAQFQHALELNPRAPMALFGRGNIYMRRRQYAAALADYDKVVQLNPNFAPAYMNRASARQALGDFAGAAADRRMEQAIRNR